MPEDILLSGSFCGCPRLCRQQSLSADAYYSRELRPQGEGVLHDDIARSGKRQTSCAATHLDSMCLAQHVSVSYELCNFSRCWHSGKQKTCTATDDLTSRRTERLTEPFRLDLAGALVRRGTYKPRTGDIEYLRASQTLWRLWNHYGSLFPRSDSVTTIPKSISSSKTGTPSHSVQ